MSMDKYEITPGTLAAIRDCQGDSQRCLGSWSLCQVCSMSLIHIGLYIHTAISA